MEIKIDRNIPIHRMLIDALAPRQLALLRTEYDSTLDVVLTVNGVDVPFDHLMVAFNSAFSEAIEDESCRATRIAREVLNSLHDIQDAMTKLEEALDQEVL